MNTKPKQETQHLPKSKRRVTALDRVLSVFGTIMLVMSLLPTQGIAEARDELAEALAAPQEELSVQSAEENAGDSGAIAEDGEVMPAEDSQAEDDSAEGTDDKTEDEVAAAETTANDAEGESEETTTDANDDANIDDQTAADDQADDAKTDEPAADEPAVEDENATEAKDAEVEERNTEKTFTYEDSDIKVTAELADPSALPAGVAFQVTPITSETNAYNYDAYMDALNADAGKKDAYSDLNTLLYDVAFLTTDEDGNTVEVQPEAGSVKVKFEFKRNQLVKDLDAPKAEDVDVIHLPLVDAATKDVATTADATNISKADVSVEPLAEGDVNAEGKKTVEITTDSFSAYGFVYTVDFIHEGETFSIAGESEILLSKLFKNLKIKADAGHAVDVTFSDPELVAVEQQEGDWLLKSLKPFTSEELLTVTMASGAVWRIKVTDAQTPTSYSVTVNFVDAVRTPTLFGSISSALIQL